MFCISGTILDRDRSRLRKKRGRRGNEEKSKYGRGSSSDGKCTNSQKTNFTIMFIEYKIDD